MISVVVCVVVDIGVVLVTVVVVVGVVVIVMMVVVVVVVVVATVVVVVVVVAAVAVAIVVWLLSDGRERLMVDVSVMGMFGFQLELTPTDPPTLWIATTDSCIKNWVRLSGW